MWAHCSQLIAFLWGVEGVVVVAAENRDPRQLQLIQMTQIRSNACVYMTLHAWWHENMYILRGCAAFLVALCSSNGQV